MKLNTMDDTSAHDNIMTSTQAHGHTDTSRTRFRPLQRCLYAFNYDLPLPPGPDFLFPRRFLHAPAKAIDGPHPLRQIQRHGEENRILLGAWLLPEAPSESKPQQLQRPRAESQRQVRKPHQNRCSSRVEGENTAKAVFDVADYSSFVVVQYESALRELAMSYAYESHNSEEISLRSGHAHCKQAFGGTAA